MSQFSSLSSLPPDALLGLMTAYREDKRAEKYDLGVGVYKNDAGETPVMRAVAKAEAAILASQTTKVYEGPRGNPDFCNAIEDFVFGTQSAARAEGRTLSFTTPGGCGALYLGISLMKRMGAKKVWVSNPTWPNHINVIKAIGLETADYSYELLGRLSPLTMLDDLEKAAPGDGVIIQGPCHNPTGIDIPVETWERLGKLAADKKLHVMIDIAYHGFAEGLTADMAGPRAFLQAAGEVMIAYSCSKNFGLYRERAGCFLALGEDATSIAAASTHVADIARTSYSMPPAHGAAIVATVLGDPVLRADWEAELNDMRARMIRLRQNLSSALIAKTGSNRLGLLAMQNGMFSQLPVSADAARDMREKHGLYLPGSGRINIAGLSDANIPHIAEIMASYF